MFTIRRCFGRRTMHSGAAFAPAGSVALERLEGRTLLHGGPEFGAAPLAGADVANSIRIDVGNVGKKRKPAAPTVDTSGAAWLADTAVSGGKVAKALFPVAGTEDDRLYSTRRRGDFAYSIATADGVYSLELLWVDTARPGKRRFNIDAEGERLETELDVSAAAGRRVALVRHYDLTVSGGALDLSFHGVTGKALLSGIELVPLTDPSPPNVPPIITPPTAPSALAAHAAQPPSAAAITLTWVDNASGETGFEVERSDDSVVFAPLLTLFADTTGHTDTTVLPGRTYWYRVRAVNDGGGSEWSAVASASTAPARPPEPPPPGPTQPAEPQPPSAPWAQVLGPTEVVVGWSDNSDNETGFVIERSTEGGPFADLLTLPAGTTRHADRTSQPATTYAYRVRAVNAAGASAATGTLTVTTPAAPVALFTRIDWTPLASAPIYRAEAFHAVLEGKLYVFGGFSGEGGDWSGPTARADVYDPVTNTWRRIADFPGRWSHAGAASDGQYGYFAGPYVGVGPGPGWEQVFASKEVWRYDPRADAYDRLPDLPQARGSAPLVLLGRELHLYGGSDLSRADRGDHWVLNLDNTAAGWRTLAPMPNPRSHMGFIALGGKLYAIGGERGHDEGLVSQNTVHEYDPATDRWIERAPMPKPVNHISESTVTYGNRIVVFGGQIDHLNGIADVFAFDPTANAWSSLAPMPWGKSFSGDAAVIDGVIYYTGGSGGRERLWEGRPVLA